MDKWNMEIWGVLFNIIYIIIYNNIYNIKAFFMKKADTSDKVICHLSFVTNVNGRDFALVEYKDNPPRRDRDTLL